MFTGIIEEKGRIKKIVRNQIFIESDLENKKGDSIAVQGICFTVADVGENEFSVQAMRQTKRITTMQDWKRGDYVNLERALKFDGRIGGHIVLGHIDEVGKCIRIKKNEYYFQAGSGNARYLIPKGSIALDGVSLTLSYVSGNIFAVSLIPYTLKETTLGRLRVGSFVNIEYDYLGKLLARRINP